MHWTYLIIPLTVVLVAGVVLRPVAARTRGHRHRSDRRAGRVHPSALRGVTLLGPECPSTCVACGCPVSDEETHWKAIHHVPA